MDRMKEEKLFAVLVSYLKQHLSAFLGLGMAMLIFAGVFSLYTLPVEAVAYASVLTMAAFCIIGSIRFVHFYNRHRLLCGMRKKVMLSILDLPAPHGKIEEDYQLLLQILDRSKTDILSENDRSITDMTDYYTLWAHQIKTPIAAMSLLLQREESEANSELAEQLFKIQQYVEMVLQYLRMEGPASDLVIKSYPLDGIVRQAVRKTARLFIRKKIRLDLSELDCMVLTDEKWLCFVLEQLLSNALKYTPEGSVSISLDDSLPKTLIIRDTGIGIRPEDLPRVFEKGYTGDNGRTGQQSTGIGLYLCRKVLHKLSHTIAIESELGVGTAVKIGLESCE